MLKLHSSMSIFSGVDSSGHDLTVSMSVNLSGFHVQHSNDSFAEVAGLSGSGSGSGGFIHFLNWSNFSLINSVASSYLRRENRRKAPCSSPSVPLSTIPPISMDGMTVFMQPAASKAVRTFSDIIAG